ncbi:hypothetical protein O6H91_04G021900 [Diphasiastrum complanatum]|uniref:Uncharacterized protein n=2 Tax=Diphasiastrum complanatum TaxID=34168 RepID=A0ACC2DUX7_DIPCM|nr:hypothetical protein O6H91_04G021900 [Diphasiastrum complanatum]KAJ7558021.1 hypothetical protein O6H91_04G021900 [Diphasiastrum complanatum]
MMRCWIDLADIKAWFQSYDRLQHLAVVFLYVQVACAFIGSLGALYSGVLVVHLALALFALVAIESGSQTLGRTYAGLLGCAVLLDIAWFMIFTYEIRFANKDNIFGKFSVISLRLVLWMQFVGFAVRILSSFLWVQMYHLGASNNEEALYQPLDFEGRARSVDFTPESSPTSIRQSSLSDEVLAGSIYNPAYYASLFQSAQGPYLGTKAINHNDIPEGDPSYLAGESNPHNHP